MQRFSDAVITPAQYGLTPVAGATVGVYLQGTNTLAPIYAQNSDASQTQNPFMTDNYGNIDFYAPNGRYDIRVRQPGGPQVAMPDVQFWDPADADFEEIVLESIEVFPGNIEGDPEWADIPRVGSDEVTDPLNAQALAISKRFVALTDTGAGVGAALIGRGVVAVDSIADLLALPPSARRGDLRYLVREYYAGLGFAGGDLSWSAGTEKSTHDGVTYFSPTVPPPADQDPNSLVISSGVNIDEEKQLFLFRSGTGESDPGGDGVFVSKGSAIDLPILAASQEVGTQLNGNEDIYIRNPVFYEDYIITLCKGEYGSLVDESGIGVYSLDEESGAFNTHYEGVIPEVGEEWRTIFTYGHYLYVANHSSNKIFHIYDIKNPAAPVYLKRIEIGSLTSTGMSGPIQFGSILFFGLWGGSALGSFDFSDPLNPVFIQRGGVASSSSGSEVFYCGGYIWQLLYGDDYLARYTINEATGQVVSATYFTDPEITNVRRGELVGGILYFGHYNGTGINAVDISGDTPVLVNRFDGDVSDIGMFGGRIFGGRNATLGDFSMYEKQEGGAWRRTILALGTSNYTSPYKDGILNFRVNDYFPEMQYWKCPSSWGVTANRDGMSTPAVRGLERVVKNQPGYALPASPTPGPMTVGTSDDSPVTFVHGGQEFLNIASKNWRLSAESVLERVRNPGTTGNFLQRRSFLHHGFSLPDGEVVLLAITTLGGGGALEIRGYLRRTAGGSLGNGSFTATLSYNTSGTVNIDVSYGAKIETGAFVMPVISARFAGSGEIELVATSAAERTNISMVGYIEGNFGNTVTILPS